MNVNQLPSELAPRCSGSSNVPGRPGSIPNLLHVQRPTSWHSQERALLIVFFVALVASPATVSAAPPTLKSGAHTGIDGIRRRGQDSSSPNSNGSISMTVWLPILLVTVMFVLFSLVTCLRRCAASDAIATTQAASGPNSATTTRPRRRPRRTPSQISTKSLPPYMKEPGDHELVLFRGPSETEDDQALPHAIPTLAEEDEEHPEMRNTTFDVVLDRIESVDTMADSSTTNLIRRVSESVTRPPELHHATMAHGHHRSVDTHSLGSAGSEAELLPSHQLRPSVEGHDEPRGEAPSYTEAVFAMTAISLNDPEPSASSNAVAPAAGTAAGGRSRFSFLKHNPFSSHNSASSTLSNVSRPSPSTRSESPAAHVRSGSALSRFSSRESHESHHSRAPSRNHNLSRSHSRSNSNLFRTFHAHPSGLHAGSSTISLDSISAPLTHTLKRAEFYAPKGGLLTPEQVKLITSREALERFGMPYGPDAVAAFSLSRDRLAEAGPPPDFESATGEHQEQSNAPGSSGSTETAAQRSDTTDLEAAPPHSPLTLQPPSHGSHTSTDMSVQGRGSLAQIVQVYTSEDERGNDRLDEPHTAQPMTPETARPWSLSRDQGSVSRSH